MTARAAGCAGCVAWQTSGSIADGRIDRAVNVKIDISDLKVCINHTAVAVSALQGEQRYVVVVELAEYRRIRPDIMARTTGRLIVTVPDRVVCSVTTGKIAMAVCRSTGCGRMIVGSAGSGREAV
jgi:hypothetical protein